MSWPQKVPKYSHEVLATLKECARQRRLITYGQIEKETGLIARAVPFPLRYIEDHICRPYGRPWLSALVIAKDKRIPGSGFKPEGFAVDDHKLSWWYEETQRVYDYDWSDIEIED